MDEEVALYRAHYPLSDAAEADFREALGKTLHAAQLRLADAAGDAGDAVLAELKKVSDRARDRSLREFFRRFW